MLCFETTKMPGLALNHFFNSGKMPSVSIVGHERLWVGVQAQAALGTLLTTESCTRGVNTAPKLPKKNKNTCQN